MSLLDAHIPQLVAAQSAFGTKAALMRHTIGQAEQAAMSAQAFHQGESAAAFQAAHARFVEVAARVNTLLDIAQANLGRCRRYVCGRRRRGGVDLHRVLTRANRLQTERRKDF